MELVGRVAWWLAVLGAINLGLVGLNIPVVQQILDGVGLTAIVYVLVGASGVYLLVTSLGKK